MAEGLAWLLKAAQWIAGVGAGIAAINQWIIKPLRKVWEKQIHQVDILREEQGKTNTEMQKQIGEMTQKIDKLADSLATAQDDIADLLGDRLGEAHETMMSRGWCTEAEKQRIVSLHQRYTARGHNHLADMYEEDILRLPNSPEVR